MNVEIKQFYTAKELAEMNLASLPNFHVYVRNRAKKESWLSQKRSGRGGGVEYAFNGLPKDVQNEIKQKRYKSMMTVDSKAVAVRRESREVAVLSRDLDELDGYQRDVAMCRMRMVLLVEQWRGEHGGGVVSTCKAISKLSRDEALPVDRHSDTDWNAVCDVARDGTYKQKGIGLRKLQEWCILYNKYEGGDDRLRALAPGKRGMKYINPLSCEWLPEFLAIYCQPQCWNIAETHFKMMEEIRFKNPDVDMSSLPSLASCRRVFNRLPKAVRTKGRASGSAKRALYAYVKRDWNAPWMQVNDMWVIDGHSMKVRVKHPVHGQPFNPEVTLVMDCVSRVYVGWSVSFSESTEAVGAAYSHGFKHYGIPATAYSDNGAGEVNKALDGSKKFDTDMTGAFTLLGIEHPTGIPGNAQGRGIIERPMKGVPKRVAKSFATYHGKDADPNYVRETLSCMNAYKKAVVNKKTDEEMTPKELKGRDMLPSWVEFMAVLEKEIYDYNNKRKHSAIGMTPARKYEQVKAMHDTEIVMPTEYQLKTMFYPSFKRKVDRGQIRFDNKLYRDIVLEDLDGVYVAVYVDIHDPATVIIRDMDDVYLCEARLNRVDGFEKSRIETNRESRDRARLKNKQDQMDAIKAEGRKTLDNEGSGNLSDLLPDTFIEGECVDVTDKPDDGLGMFKMVEGYDKKAV